MYITTCSYSCLRTSWPRPDFNLKSRPWKVRMTIWLYSEVRYLLSMGLGKYSEQFISRCCTSSWTSSTKTMSRQFYASSLILSSLHGGAVLAVDRLVAILTLVWSPAAFATSKSFGETGTLECWENVTSMKHQKKISSVNMLDGWRTLVFPDRGGPT